MPAQHRPTSFARSLLTALLLAALAVASLGSLAFSADVAHAAGLNVGVVDFNRVIEATEKDRAIAAFEKDINKRKADLKGLEQEILKMEGDLKQNMAILSDEEKKTRLMAYQKKAYDFQQKMVMYEQEVLKTRKELFEQLTSRLKELSVGIAQEKKLDLMLEANEGAVLYFNASFDFTDELTKRYKAKYP